jgi:hypothetical protein
MARRATTFRQRDLTAAVKGAIAAGCMVSSVEVDPITGKITVLMGVATANEPTTDLDKWIAKHAR